MAQSGDDAVTAVPRTYQKFGRLEARGRSAAYEVLAESVAGDAVLLPALAQLPQPLALIEAGASAGLNLRAGARRPRHRADREPRDVAAVAALIGERRR